MGLTKASIPDENTRSCYGYTFQLTPDHLTPEQLAPMKYTYDTLGEEALERIDKLSPPPPSRPSETGSGDTLERDMYALLRDNANKDKTLKKLWDEINTVPEWVDWKQVERGQDVFYRYAAPAVAAFALQGLFGSTGASDRPAETLVRTGGHSAKVARHRFFETFQLLLQVAQSLDGIKPGGSGFITVVRVRFLHATVRNRILKLAEQRPSYFDTEKYGVPINDADMIQSLCAFSANVLWIGLRKQGIFVRKQEAADYIALWRWVGHVIGAPTWCLETPRKAFVAMEYIRLEAFHPSDNGRVLIHNIVKALEGVPPAYASRDYWEAGSRWFNGDKLCDELGLGKPGLYYQALMAGQTWTFMVLCYTCRSIPWLDRWKITYLRKLFWDYIVLGEEGLGKEATYEFKYIPKFGEITGAEDAGPTGAKYPGVERIALYGLLHLCFSIVTLIYAIVKLLGVAGVKLPYISSWAIVGGF